MTIRALSIKQPWAELIVAGRKSVEVRTWWPREQFGTLIAIHAGRSIAEDAPARVRGLAYEACNTWPQRRGGIVGVAQLCGAVRYRDEADFVRAWEYHQNPPEWWEEGTVGFEFDRPARFLNIIPCRGQLMFFELAADIERRVRAELAGMGVRGV